MNKKVVIVTEIEVDSKDFWKELVADIVIHAINKKDGAVTRRLIATQDGVEVKDFPHRENEYIGSFQTKMFNQGYNKALQDVEHGIKEKAEKGKILSKGEVVKNGKTN